MNIIASSMQIDSNVYHLINVLFKVILYSLIISTPFIILTIELYGYERYKKWKDTEVKEKNKIILGRANKIVKQDEELSRQNDDRRKLTLEVELLEQRKKGLEKIKKDLTIELGIEEEHDSDETAAEETVEVKPDLKTMNIKQLKALAKERGLTMYSKKNKKALIKMLEG